MTEPRRVPTEVERTAGHVHLDPELWRLANPSLGIRVNESVTGSRPAPECLTSHPQMHADCDGCTCSCHPQPHPALVLLSELMRQTPIPPRRRWWHRLTRRAL